MAGSTLTGTRHFRATTGPSGQATGTLNMRAWRNEQSTHRLRSAVAAALRLEQRLRLPHVVVAATLATLSACGGSSSDDPSMPRPAATCGNGAVQAAEQCDDGNDVNGDGCAFTCFVENGWRCEETTPSGRSTCARLVGSFFASDPVSGRLDSATLLPEEGRAGSEGFVTTGDRVCHDKRVPTGTSTATAGPISSWTTAPRSS